MGFEVARTNTDTIQELIMRDEPSKREKLYYGLGTIGWVTMSPLISSFLSFYYTNVVGLAAAFVGTLMLVGRLFDGVSDISVGILLDRTRSKYGQARPWLLLASFPMALSFALIFSVPGLGAVGQEIYAGTSYIAFTLLYTAILIPYNTLLGLMSRDTNHRTTTNAYRGIFGITGTIVVMVLTIPVVNVLGGGKSGWMIVAGVVALITFLAILLGFRKVKERVSLNKIQENVAPIKISIKALLANKYWVRITLFSTVNHLLTAIIMGSGTYYVVTVFGNSNYFSLFAAASLTPSVLALFFIAPLARKFGKRNVALFASIIACAGPVLKLVNPADITVVFIANFIQGFCIIAVFTLIEAMINDTVEYGEWKSGVRTAGLVNSGTSLGEKVGTGLGAAVVGWSLAVAGYVGGHGLQTDEARRVIIYDLNIYFPLALCICQVVILYFCKLDEILPSIVKELRNRDASRS